MCFSATASFSAGAILAMISIVSFKKSTKQSEHFFAAIPLLFAVQQFAEGFLWLLLSNTSYPLWEKICVILFISIAHSIWPIWVPLSIQKLEPDRLAKQLLTLVTGIGIIVSLYLAWCFITFGINAKIDGYHISYVQTYPNTLEGWGGYFYFFVTIFPTFISSLKRMWMLGVAVLVSYFITEIYYDNYLISVWCFFAAVISSIVYYIVLEIKK